MNDTSSLADFDAATRHLARAFNQWVAAQAPGARWDRATLEVRYAADGSYWHDKMRVEVAGQPTLSLGTNDELRSALAGIKRLREMFSRKFYALTLELGPDATVSIVYGYDANCADDASFFDD